mgnify:CR=1 FL=1
MIAMQSVEQHSYVHAVLSPLSVNNGLGEALDDHPILDQLETHIMKVGSLSQNDIPWERIEADSLALLSEQGKDLRVLGFLLLALQKGGNGERFALSLYLLCEVLERWWAEAGPWPGERGQRGRRRLFGQIIQRASAEADRLSFDAARGEGRQYSLKLIERLTELAEAKSLDASELGSLRRQIATPTREEASGPSADQAESPATASGRTTETVAETGSSAARAVPPPALDTGSERAIRQTLLQTAQWLNDTNPAMALGYQLRRHALWHAITAAPPSRADGRTDLAAVSSDRVSEYTEALRQAPDATLWQRIEQSLSVSPFWLDGHRLSAEVAAALGHSDCAEAIRLALAALVTRLPALESLAFSDGTPFLTSETTDWLATAPASGHSVAGGDAWEQALAEAIALLPDQGLNRALALLDEGLAEAREPRARLYWQLVIAELMQAAGLTTLARQQAEDLLRQVQAQNLEQWEPDLLKRLQRTSRH